MYTIENPIHHEPEPSKMQEHRDAVMQLITKTLAYYNYGIVYCEFCAKSALLFDNRNVVI